MIAKSSQSPSTHVPGTAGTVSDPALRFALDLQVKPSAAKAVLVALASHYDAEGGICCPTRQALAHATCQDRKTVAAGLRRLRQLDLVQDTGWRRGETNRIVVYRIRGLSPPIPTRAVPGHVAVVTCRENNALAEVDGAKTGPITQRSNRPSSGPVAAVNATKTGPITPAQAPGSGPFAPVGRAPARGGPTMAAPVASDGSPDVREINAVAASDGSKIGPITHRTDGSKTGPIRGPNGTKTGPIPTPSAAATEVVSLAGGTPVVGTLAASGTARRDGSAKTIEINAVAASDQPKIGPITHRTEGSETGPIQPLNGTKTGPITPAGAASWRGSAPVAPAAARSTTANRPNPPPRARARVQSQEVGTDSTLIRGMGTVPTISTGTAKKASKPGREASKASKGSPPLSDVSSKHPTVEGAVAAKNAAPSAALPVGRGPAQNATAGTPAARQAAPRTGAVAPSLALDLASPAVDPADADFVIERKQPQVLAAEAWNKIAETTKLVAAARPPYGLVARALKHPAIGQDLEAWRTYCRWVARDSFLGGHSSGTPADLVQACQDRYIDRWANSRVSKALSDERLTAMVMADFYEPPPIDENDPAFRWRPELRGQSYLSKRKPDDSEGC